MSGFKCRDNLFVVTFKTITHCIEWNKGVQFGDRLYDMHSKII